MYTNENHLDLPNRTDNSRGTNGHRIRNRSRSSTVSVKRKIKRSYSKDNNRDSRYSESRKYYKYRDPYEKEFLRQSQKYNTKERDDRRDEYKIKDTYRDHRRESEYKVINSDVEYGKYKNDMSHRRLNSREYKSIEKTSYKRESPSRHRSKRRSSLSRERSSRRYDHRSKDRSRERSFRRGTRSRERSRRYRSKSRTRSTSRNKINHRSKSPEDRPIEKSSELDFAALRRKNRRTTKSNSAMRVMKV